MATSVFALDKSQVNLDQDFWGKWTITNAKAKCNETYTFSKPGYVTYQAKEKIMTGDFAVLRSTDKLNLDVLAMKVKTDNKLAGCAGEPLDYTNSDIRLTLKWMTTKSAELCTDMEGKKCTGLYLIKQ